MIYGYLPDGREVNAVELRDGSLTARILTLGAGLQDLRFDGSPMILGSTDTADYTRDLIYAGAVVGRVAGRIKAATAEIGGQRYTFDANEANGNCLHGGIDGAANQIWQIKENSSSHVVLTLNMPDGHMGFPGALKVEARYALIGATLTLDITAHSSQETLCSFAPHCYFNLSGSDDINRHNLRIAADHYLPLDETLVPTGEVAEVGETRFDYRAGKALGQAELDHNFCLCEDRRAMQPVLWLSSPDSGVTMELATTEPGVQIYDASHMAKARAGLAIEPQLWPAAVHHPHFPSAVLKAGAQYSARHEFRFSKI